MSEMETSVRGILEELKRLDPACYAEIERGLAQVDIEYEEDIIQGACQRAIAAIGGYQDITGIKCKGYRWMAYIHCSEIDLTAQSSLGESPAKALLSSYIAARGPYHEA